MLTKPELTAGERRALDGYYAARDEHDADEAKIWEMKELRKQVRCKGNLVSAVRKAIRSGDDDFMALAAHALDYGLWLYEEGKHTSGAPLFEMEVIASWPSFKRAMEKINGR